MSTQQVNPQGEQQPADKPKPPNKMELLKSILKAPSVQEQFENALKENSGIFVASIIDLFNGDKYLQECDPKAVVMEALKAATLKLPINKNLGFAYVIAYSGAPQFQLGYKGYIQLAMRTGQYRIINADVVYEGEYKTKNKLTGEFDLSGEATSSKIIGYFAHIEMLNGFSKTLYMTVEKVREHAKRYSKSYTNQYSAWSTNFDEMAIKTPLRNLLSHYGYLSVEMINAFGEDTSSDTVDNQMQQDIIQKANKSNISFDEAEIVPPDAEQPGVNNNSKKEDPGF